MVLSIKKKTGTCRNIEYPKNIVIEHSRLNNMFSRVLIFFSTLFLISIFSPTCFGQETKNIEKYDSALVYAHSPRTASFYSAVLPGLGQAYNKKYWKMPIVYAGLITSAYFIYYNNDYYKKFKKAYIYRTDGDPSTNAEFYYFGTYTSNFPDANELKGAMGSYRRYRDMSALILGGVYLLNIIDATVDAYLFDYDVDQNLSLNIRPAVFNSPYSVNFGISCTLRF
jgi:hypothetical protein